MKYRGILPRIFLVSILLVLVYLGTYIIFKNLSFPLLWNDEAETAMFGESILEYGYPKVHLEKNVLNVSELPDKTIGVKKGFDAWIYISSWGQYYLAAPFVSLAKNYDNNYFKTFLLRLPFTLTGISGIYLLALFVILELKVVRTELRLFLVILFLLFEFSSVPLILHLRQMRHYGADILLISLYVYVFCKNIQRRNIYLEIVLFLNLILLLNFYTPAFFALGISTFLYILISGIKGKIDKLSFVKNIWFLLLVGILSLPYLAFFEFFKISNLVSKQFDYSFLRGIAINILNFRFFWKYEFLYIYLVVGVLLFLKYKEIVKEKIFKYFLFLNLTLFAFVLLTSRIPYFFERYVIIFQPVYYLSLILGIALLYKAYSISSSKFKYLFYYLFFLLLIPGVMGRGILLPKYINEIKTPYRGVVDEIVDAISKRYKDTSNLVIATNYEEQSLMYYLGSHVTVGYVENNIEKDSKIIPDIVLIRKKRPNSVKVLNKFLGEAKYTKITYNTYDYSYNNIPDLEVAYPHLFTKMIPTKDEDKLAIYYKVINKKE